MTPELLLGAGVQAAQERAGISPPLGQVLGVKLSDVLDRAADLLRGQGIDMGRRVSAPLLYKHWRDFDDFLTDLVARLFPATGFDLSALEQEADLAAAIRRHVLNDRQQMAEQDVALYFGMFRGVANPTVGQALGRVYDAYDERVIPVLDEALRRAGRRPRRSLGDRAAGLAAIATALTAMSEGLMLRSMVQADRVADDAVWSESAVALLMGLTEDEDSAG